VRSALMIADDLAELPEPPDACTSGGRATAGAAPRLELPWECGALAGCAGELAVDWLADLDRTDNGVRVLGQTAVLDRPEGVYAVDLATCKVLWRLPLRATPAGLTPRFVLLRAHWGAAGGLLGLDRTRIQDAARGRPPWWEPDAGPLEVRVGVGRTAPLRAGPDRQAAEVGEVPDGGHLLFDLMSPRRSLGQPFYRLFREPAVPGGELPERWIWGGDVVPVDTAARWTPDRCQALAWRGRRRTLRDATIVP